MGSRSPARSATTSRPEPPVRLRPTVANERLAAPAVVVVEPGHRSVLVGVLSASVRVTEIRGERPVRCDGSRDGGGVGELRLVRGLGARKASEVVVEGMVFLHQDDHVANLRGDGRLHAAVGRNGRRHPLAAGGPVVRGVVVGVGRLRRNRRSWRASVAAAAEWTACRPTEDADRDRDERDAAGDGDGSHWESAPGIVIRRLLHVEAVAHSSKTTGSV